MKKAMMLLVAVTLGLTTIVNATNPPAVAVKLPAGFKAEVASHIDYPDFAQHNLIEGEVWMKVTLDENKMVQIVDLSATNPELGEYVKNELTGITLEGNQFPVGHVYYMKVAFDLVK